MKVFGGGTQSLPAPNFFSKSKPSSPNCSGCNGDSVGEVERNLTSHFFDFTNEGGDVSLRFEEFAGGFQRARAKAEAHALTNGPSL